MKFSLNEIQSVSCWGKWSTDATQQRMKLRVHGFFAVGQFIVRKNVSFG